MFWTILALLATAVCIAEAFRPIHRRGFRRPQCQLPPGPQGLPIVGNLIQFRAARRPGKMDSYLLSMREFGEMTTLHMGSQLWVLLNTNRVAHDIISAHPNITIERPSMPIAHGLVSGGKRSVVQPASAWKRSRRIMRHLLTSQSMANFVHWQDRESVRMLRNFLHTPEKWFEHQARYAVGVLLGVILGESEPKSTEQIAEYRTVTKQFLGSIFASWVDFFPALAHLPRPLQFWRAHWTGVGRFHQKVFEDWWQATRARIANGQAGASFVRDVLLNADMGFAGGEDEALYLANSLISAGNDNTRMAMNTFALAIVTHQDAFQRARAEIDAVCGSSAQRLPQLADMPDMRYLCAFIKETLRWRPIVPLLLPRQLSEELEYDGFVFPEETNFLVNVVAISADCESADAFRPERWLDGNETKLEHGFWGFGAGRRICIGYRAEQPALFLALSRLIYCFDYESNGPIDIKSLDPWTIEEPFPLTITCRSAAHAQLVNDAAQLNGFSQR